MAKARERIGQEMAPPPHAPDFQARQVLALLGLGESEVEQARDRLLAHKAPTMREACELEQARIVAAAATLGADGWTVAAGDVKGLAALHAVAAMLAAETGPGGALESQALAADAVFMLGRDDMRRAVEAAEAAKRQARGAKGGRPVVIPDELIRTVWERELRIHRGKTRGLLKHVAHQLTDRYRQPITETTLAQRLRKLGLRG